jgi:hypothetical protein
MEGHVKGRREENRAARREFLQQMSAAGLATLGLNAPQVWGDESVVVHPQATADSCIVLWMGGGMAAPDTFDPKKYVPFEVGIPVEQVESTFPAIDSVVDNIKLTEGLEEIAKVMDRGTLIRSLVLPDLGSILHSRHQYHWHTGYVPPQTVACPHIGSWANRIDTSTGVVCLCDECQKEFDEQLLDKLQAMVGSVYTPKEWRKILWEREVMRMEVEA